LNDANPEKVRRGRLKLALLGAFFILPFAASWAIWKFDLASGTSGNYGELLPPRQVTLPPDPALKGKWVLVIFAGGDCDAACERQLYFVRQVRRAQGKQMNRVERLWLVTDAARPRPEVLAAIEGTVIAQAAGRTDFPPAGAPGGDVRAHVYLVDPLGNLMMRFPREPDPSRVIKDLQRLLRASSFG
jgi:hypothetical protein